MRAADFHEDDYCQIEILPEANWEHVQAEFVKLIAFSREHQSPGSFGWSDIYVRADPPTPLAPFGLRIEELSKCLERHLLPFDRVTTGWSSVVERLPSAHAWGNDRAFVVFADFDDAGTVQNLWLNVGAGSE